MTEPSGGIEEKMAALKASYLESLVERRVDIKNALDGLDGEATSCLDSIRHHAHKTAGSGGTFGFAAISETARALELAADGLIGAENVSVYECRETLTPLAQTLFDALDKAGSVEVSAPASRPADTGGQPGDVILIVTPDPGLMKTLAHEIENFGFSISTLRGLADIEGYDGTPVAAVIDMPVLDNGAPDADLINRLKEKGALDFPLIFVSADGDLPCRLVAARVGAAGYLLKPVVTTYLIDVLDRIGTSDDFEPYRVLIVDDDVSVSNYNKVILENDGMITKAINDPLTILDVLEDFSPEIILMDLYMPECNGYDLASVIRQRGEFSGIPIVFLSSETDISKQLEALSHGGDGFLTKPITPRHLIDSVRIRAERFRMIRNLMVRDSLTGLYNHTTTKQLLENEIARASREKTPVSFAMIDIDHFKSVNDTHGHGVGDVVIKSLSRLLKQRLRGADLIGRMGGEEFAAILPGATGEEAEKVINAVRIAFSEIENASVAGDFTATFSCGVAEYPAFETGASLSDGADKALYEAKTGGRNRVVRAH